MLVEHKINADDLDLLIPTDDPAEAVHVITEYYYRNQAKLPPIPDRAGD